MESFFKLKTLTSLVRPSRITKSFPCHSKLPKTSVPSVSTMRSVWLEREMPRVVPLSGICKVVKSARSLPLFSTLLSRSQKESILLAVYNSLRLWKRPAFNMSLYTWRKEMSITLAGTAVLLSPKMIIRIKPDSSLHKCSMFWRRWGLGQVCRQLRYWWL